MRRRGHLDPRSPRLAEGLRDLLELAPDDLPPRRLVVEQLLDLLGPLPLLRQLVQDVANLQLAQAVELGLQDRVGLERRDLEPRHQLGGGVGLAVAGADDRDRLVQVLEDDREAFEDVDPLEQVPQLESQPPGDDLQAEVEELLEDRLQIQAAGNGHLGPLGRQQAGEIDAVVDLEGRVLEKVGQGRIGDWRRL